MKQLMIVAMAIVLPISLFTVPAFAEIQYGELPNKFSHQPLICIYEPIAPDVRQQILDVWMKEVEIGVKDWEYALKSTEYVKNDRWTINSQKILVQDRLFFDNTDCDVEVRFVQTDPEGTAAGWHYFDGVRHQIELVYTDKEVCNTWTDAYYRYTEWCYKDDLIRSKALGNTATHEIGHAIGLGHYESSDLQVNYDWSSDPVSSPSIMTLSVHYNEEKNKIRNLDLDKVREIYGDSGFGEPKQTVTQEKSIFENKNLGGFESLFTLESEYYKEPGKTYYLTISGKVTEKAYSKGQNILLTTIFPDGHDEEQKVLAVVSRDFATQMRVDHSAQSGEYEISARYMGYDSEKITFSILDASSKPTLKVIPKSIPESKEPISIPTWVKNNAKWWSEGTINDKSFTQGIEYLITEKVINVPIIQNTVSDNDKIPLWIKTNANWWADGLISDSDFVKGIEYLVNSGIIQVQ